VPMTGNELLILIIPAVLAVLLLALLSLEHLLLLTLFLAPPLSSAELSDREHRL